MMLVRCPPLAFALQPSLLPAASLGVPGLPAPIVSRFLGVSPRPAWTLQLGGRVRSCAPLPLLPVLQLGVAVAKLGGPNMGGAS